MNWQQQLRRGTSVDGALQYVRNTRESRCNRSRVEEKKTLRERGEEPISLHVNKVIKRRQMRNGSAGERKRSRRGQSRLT